jgi:S1-C subfamily serine protease
VEVAPGKIEPLCQAGQPNGHSVLIGSQGAGSGFFVSDNGHIVTNRHVAASWNTAYTFPPGSFPGILYQQNRRGEYEIAGFDVTEDMVTDFVPSGMLLFGFDMMKEKRVVKGENAYLDVVLPGKDNRIPASIANISDEHDVAMIKIDLPGSQPYVRLDEKSPDVSPGKEVVVMGYPGISPNQVKVVRSQDYFNRADKLRERPEPSVSNGTIAKIVSGSSIREELYSNLGDLYQLNINTTGAGNSGGPVFDRNGNVIGIYTSGGGTSNMGIISFAVPVKYALNIMGG